MDRRVFILHRTVMSGASSNGTRTACEEKFWSSRPRRSSATSPRTTGATGHGPVAGRQFGPTRWRRRSRDSRPRRG